MWLAAEICSICMISFAIHAVYPTVTCAVRTLEYLVSDTPPFHLIVIKHGNSLKKRALKNTNTQA